MQLEKSDTSKSLVKMISRNIRTWHHNHAILYDLACMFEGKINYVEIGCFAGASACLLLQRPNTKVIAIDTEDAYTKEQVLTNIADYRYNKYNNQFIFIKGSSKNKKVVNSVQSLIGDNGIHVLFIDGDHSVESAKEDFRLYAPLVRKGGWIVFDDYGGKDCPGVKIAVDEMKENGIFEAYIEYFIFNEYILQKL